ncbi:MAG: peptidoglycan DD-metalloendopeptidase family protein [Gammaproteobacteria bacterium]
MSFLHLILLLLLCANTAEAKKLYKYQDDRGLWHYTDKPPLNKNEVETRQLKVAPKQYVWLERAGSRNKPEYFIRNNYPGPIEAEIEFIERVNIYSEPKLPKRFVVQPGESESLIHLGAINPYQPSSFRLQYRYTLGAPASQYDEASVYLPPIAAMDRFQISQAFGGEFSHTDPQNRYAVDIMMPEGTPIHAARSGMVIEVENDFFNGGGTLKTYKNQANSIRILHPDGSMAVYAHLQLEKARVHPGMEVSAGQLIGYSGNTGFTTGPHLHFAVHINAGMELVSVPFKFATLSGIPVTPQAGQWIMGVR